MRKVILAAVLVAGAIIRPMAANDLDIPMALQGSNEWSIIVPANTTSVRVLVPYDPAEWQVSHSLTISLIDGNGVLIGGGNPNTGIAIDKWTGLAGPFIEGIVMGFEREAFFPSYMKMLSAFTIDGVKFRQVGIFSPLTVRVTVDDGAPGQQLTYGVSAVLGTKSQQSAFVP